MTERLEQDLMNLKLAEPTTELDARVLELLRVEEPLRAMKLREPSRAMDDRIAAMFAEAPGSDAPATYAFAALVGRIALPLAACLAIGLTVFFATRDGDNPSEATGPDIATVTPPVVEVEPVRYDSTVVNDAAGDVIILDDELPVVPIRRQAIQTTRWVDEANNVEIEMTVPREQMLIVPVQVD